MGIEELVLDGLTGFIVPSGDSQAIAERIIRIFRDPLLSDCLSQAALRYVEACFDVRQTTELRQQIYTAIQSPSDEPDPGLVKARL
jgi:glycosyltransferase involved in cell wall biosynthesis